MFSRKSTFFFTFGIEGHPFRGGWTEVEAPDINAAIALFRALHPDKTTGILNCSSVYTEEQFTKTAMFRNSGGNLGARCHERITVTRVIND